jgi:sigma-B regulation protein RsbU (phosphoserine phosphatase)
LQARDAIIGLRMGVEERMRLTATIEKLNAVIARSALASKFISMFYGELERNGTLVYCNAGHVPPLVFSGGRVSELTRGGRVLGPIADAQYERGYVMLRPGDLLLATTDGILEAENERGHGFGTERIKAIVREGRFGSAREIVESIFDEARRFTGRATPVDDQTVLAVVRRAAPV